MNRIIQIAGFLLGTALLLFLVIHSGPAVLWRTLVRSAWVVGPLIVIWGAVYACNARAWQLLIPDRQAVFTFRAAFLLTISSFAMNFITPALSLGGEPIKMAGATPLLGRDRAVGSVVSFRLLHAVAHMIVVLGAIIPAAILLPHTPAILAMLGVLALICATMTGLLLASHRDGIFARGVALLGRLPLVRALAPRLEKHRDRLHELDRELSAVHTAPGQFRWALATEVAGRIASSLESVVILYGLGLGIDLPRAFVISTLGSVFTMVFFFMPFEMGAREASAYLIFGWLGFPPALGTSAALLSRVRELVWAAVGIGALLPTGLRRRDPERA